MPEALTEFPRGEIQLITFQRSPKPCLFSKGSAPASEFTCGRTGSGVLGYFLHELADSSQPNSHTAASFPKGNF